MPDPDAIHEELLDFVATTISGLSLTDSPAVVKLSVPLDDKKDVPNLPAIVVTPFGVESIDPRGGTNESEDIGYPVLVAMIEQANGDQTTDRNKRLLWRQKIVDALIHTQPTIVTTFARPYDLTIEPADITSLPGWLFRQKSMSVLTARIWVRKKRRAA